MALPSSGSISFADIQAEFGGANPISLSEYYRGGSYVTSNNTSVPISGIIQLNNFYGAVKQFSLVISSNQIGQSLRDIAIGAGWNQSDFLLATNNAVLSSSSTAVPALTISGSFPNGVALVNNSFIVGMGGAGGNYDQAGKPGGTALSATAAVTITNNGVIAGGGGGGGAGAFWVWNGYDRSTPGSGGASGLVAAAGGTTWGSPSVNGYPSGGPDGNGLYSTGGPSNNWGWGGRASSPGGIGGSWGSAGDTGGGVDGAYNYSGYAGGAGGAAVTGNGYITWVATGTRYGSIS